jgi:hypothetical protein
MSPELIAPQRFGLKSSHPTKSSDCYALGMTIYETISGNLPFHEDTDLTVFVKVLEGRRPPRGMKFGKVLWWMLERCWSPQPNNRPSIKVVLQCLVFSNLLGPPSLGVDEGMEKDSSDRDSANSSSDGMSDTGTTVSFDPGHAAIIDHPPSPTPGASQVSII